jgi:hypothetical protein
MSEASFFPALTYMSASVPTFLRAARRHNALMSTMRSASSTSTLGTLDFVSWITTSNQLTENFKSAETNEQVTKQPRWQDCLSEEFVPGYPEMWVSESCTCNRVKARVRLCGNGRSVRCGHLRRKIRLTGPCLTWATGTCTRGIVKNQKKTKHNNLTLIVHSMKFHFQFEFKFKRQF